MFDSEGELKTPYEGEKNESTRGLSGARFVLSMSVAILLVVLLLAVVLSVSNIGALTFAGIGGIYAEIDVLIGNELAAYPYPTETAACEANFSDPTVGDQSEQALTALRADVEQLIIPADSDLRLSKDIEVPEVARNIDTVRIGLERTNVVDDPSYPPQAPEGPASDGINEGAIVDTVDVGGIFVRTGTNRGYSDLRFQRTRNVTSGESVPVSFAVESNYRYGEQVDALEYPAVEAQNDFRYIDGVEIQGLDNTGTGDDGGYADYTDLSNSFDGATAPDGNLTRGDQIGITVNAMGAAPDYSQPFPPDSPSGDDTRATIDDVTFEGIDNTGTDDTGYNDFTGESTDRLDKDGTATLEVSGDKIGGPADFFEGTAKTCSIGGDGDYEITGTDDVAPFVDSSLDTDGLNGCNDWTDYDDEDFLSEPEAVAPGETFEVEFDIRTTGDENLLLPDEPGITLAKIFLDWNQDGTFEEDFVVGTASTDPDEGDPEQVVETVSAEIPVPADAEPGTTTVRLRTDGATPSDEDDAPEVDFGPDEVTGDGGDMQEFTVHVAERSQVSAFFDWNQDGNLDQEIEVYDEINKDGSYDEQVTFDVPPDAKAGSSRMRLVHRNEFDPPTPALLDGEYVGETHDYTVEVENSDTNAAVWAFFDWEQDGEFDDAQKIDDEFAPTGPWTAMGTVEAPPEALAGPTVMRVVHQQDGYDVTSTNYPEPDPDETGIDGEYHDYTVNVEPSASFVRGWVDWNGDGNPSREIDIGPIGEGDDQTRIELNGTLEAPDIDPGYRLFRLTHKQAPEVESPPSYAAGTDFQGETLDFTVVTNDEPGDISDDGNVTLGDVSFVATGLDAEVVDLEGDVLIEESFTDNTTENPKFGRDGEFILAGDDAELTNVQGVVHSVFFSFFEIPGLEMSLEYNPDNPRTAEEQACQAYPEP